MLDKITRIENIEGILCSCKNVHDFSKATLDLVSDVKLIELGYRKNNVDILEAVLDDGLPNRYRLICPLDKQEVNVITFNPETYLFRVSNKAKIRFQILNGDLFVKTQYGWVVLNPINVSKQLKKIASNNYPSFQHIFQFFVGDFESIIYEKKICIEKLRKQIMYVLIEEKNEIKRNIIIDEIQIRIKQIESHIKYFENEQKVKI